MLQNRLPTIVLHLVCKALSVFKCLTGHVNSFIDINEHTAPLVNTVNDVYTDAHMHLKHTTCSPIMWAQNCLWPRRAAKSSDLNKQHPIKRWKQTRLRPGRHRSLVCAAQRHNVLVQVEVKARMRCSIDVSHDSPEIRLSATLYGLYQWDEEVPASHLTSFNTGGKQGFFM